ncbi:tetratricopeptide repeat protein [Acidobacteria bacterium AH-259-O06]|nr:tetratricopeptide repeat protein [Acidobacteria bacterium AH-259-O06]
MKRIAIHLALLTFVVSADLSAQQEPGGRDTQPTERSTSRSGIIVGRIQLPRGEHQIPRMITVTLNTMGGSFLQRKTMNSEVSFIFANVRNGHYIITLESLGYQTVEKTIEVRTFLPNDETFVPLTLGRRLPEGDMGVPRGYGSELSAASLLIPQKARKELEKANRESENNKPEKAIQHLQKALEIYPELYQAYNNLAVQYVRLGRTAEAIDSLQKSVGLNPDDATICRNLAQLYLGQGSYGEALVPLKRSLELDAQNSKGRMLLGEVYLGMGQYLLALNYFHSAARENPKDRSYLGIGQCYLQLGLHKEALQEFKGFIAQEPKDPRAGSVREMISQLEKEL